MTAVEITDEVTFQALRAFDGRQCYSKLERMRAALEAAAPHLAPRPVVDREALEKSIRAELVQRGVDEFHDPVPLGRSLTDIVLALLNGAKS